MGRLKKEGFEFTRMDVNLWTDLKIRKAKKAHSSKVVNVPVGTFAPYVFLRIVALILKDSYYITADGDLPFFISEDTGLDEDTVRECIDILLENNLLNRDMYERHHILTSHGIQIQYNCLTEITNRKGKITDKSPYSLIISSQEMPISSEETPISSQEMPISSEETPISSENMPISFLEERKERKEKKENYYSSLSSLPEDEEKQKQAIVLYFFFKNFLEPNRQYRGLVNYNSVSGRNWKRMTSRERGAAAEMWQQLDEKRNPIQKKRFPNTFLTVWKAVYAFAKSRDGTDGALLSDLVDDCIQYTPGQLTEHGKCNLLVCPRTVKDFICSSDGMNNIIAPLLDHKLKFVTK